jgi:cytochrome P450 family 628
MSQLTANAGKAIDVTSWFKYFGLDVMGDLAFGKSFNTVREGIPHPVLKRLHDNMVVAGLLGNAPWISLIVQSLPIVRARITNWLKWCEQQVDERKKVLVIPPLSPGSELTLVFI